MERREPGTRYIVDREKPSIVRVDHQIGVQVDRDAKSLWTREFNAFLSSIPRHEGDTLLIVTRLLREHGRPLTQKELLDAAGRDTLNEDYAKRALRKARTAGILTGGRGRGSKGYGLPEWIS